MKFWNSLKNIFRKKTKKNLKSGKKRNRTSTSRVNIIAYSTEKQEISESTLASSKISSELYQSQDLQTDYETEEAFQLDESSVGDNSDIPMTMIKSEFDYVNAEKIHNELRKLKIISSGTNYLKPVKLVRKRPIQQKLYSVPLKIEKNQDSFNLSSRQIVELNVDSFVYLRKITSLQLSNNLLERIPEEIGTLSNLTTLLLSNNRLKKLPDSIGYLEKLEELRINGNYLEMLPVTITGLQRLKTLSLDSNKFREIPRQVFKLKKLTLFECDRNQFEAIPSELLNLSQLGRFPVFNCGKLLRVGELKKFEAENSSRGTPSLLECASRSIVRNRVPVLASLPKHLCSYLCRVDECSFCCGPVFDFQVVKCRHIRRSESNIPIYYRLCCEHWKSEEDRKQVALGRVAETTPVHRIGVSPRRLKFEDENFNIFVPSRAIKAEKVKSKGFRPDALIPLVLIPDWPKYPHPEEISYLNLAQ